MPHVAIDIRYWPGYSYAMSLTFIILLLSLKCRFFRDGFDFPSFHVAAAAYFAALDYHFHAA